MLETLQTRRCPHGRMADDWCIRCISDELIDLRLQGKSFAECGRTVGYSPTTAAHWIRVRARERGILDQIERK